MCTLFSSSIGILSQDPSQPSELANEINMLFQDIKVPVLEAPTDKEFLDLEDKKKILKELLHEKSNNLAKFLTECRSSIDFIVNDFYAIE